MSEIKPVRFFDIVSNSEGGYVNDYRDNGMFAHACDVRETAQQLQRENGRLTKLAESISRDCNQVANERNDLRAELAAAKQQLAEANSKFSPDWADFLGGKECGIDEFADEVKQLCKDYSDLRDRPYMADVHAAIDGLRDVCIATITNQKAARTAQAATEGEE